MAIPPSTERMKVFQASIEQMLWPERRAKDPVFGDKIPGVIDRTTARSWLRIPAGYLPDFIREHLGELTRVAPNVFHEDGVEIGPIPAGTPVDLIANLMLLPETNDPAERLRHQKNIVDLLIKLTHDLKALPPNASDEEARQVFANLTGPMLALSKCPDFVVNRGHYFGTGRIPGEAGSQQWREAVADRFPQDVLRKVRRASCSAAGRRSRDRSAAPRNRPRCGLASAAR